MPTTQGRPPCAVCGGRPDFGLAGRSRSAALPPCRNTWCSAPGRPLGAVFAVAAYRGALRRAIVAYKYGADLRWARPFATMVHAFLERYPTWFEEYAVLCPVPGYSGPGARRPWGHVELVCAEVARLAGGQWPVEALVRKVCETEPMRARTRADRRRLGRRSLGQALVVPGAAEVRDRRVLLVDDVCASGQTLLAVAGALRRAGAAEVSAIVLARADWRTREASSP
jgi:predicted amidophosphoribosyltransferase